MKTLKQASQDVNVAYYAVNRAVRDDVYGAVNWAVYNAVNRTVNKRISGFDD